MNTCIGTYSSTLGERVAYPGRHSMWVGDFSAAKCSLKLTAVRARHPDGSSTAHESKILTMTEAAWIINPKVRAIQAVSIVI